MYLSDGIALTQSRTFWAALLSLVAITAQQFGLSGLFKWAADPGAIDTVLAVISAVGSVGAVVFRVTATQQITSITSSEK